MDTPTWTHQELLGELYLQIRLYIKQKRGKCRVLPAPFAVYIKKDNRNYVEPDISVICDMEKQSEKGCHGVPDWIVDAEAETVSVYDFEHDKNTARYSFSERIKRGSLRICGYALLRWI